VVNQLSVFAIQIGRVYLPLCPALNMIEPLPVSVRGETAIQQWLDFHPLHLHQEERDFIHPLIFMPTSSSIVL